MNSPSIVVYDHFDRPIQTFRFRTMVEARRFLGMLQKGLPSGQTMKLFES